VFAIDSVFAFRALVVVVEDFVGVVCLALEVATGAFVFVPATSPFTSSKTHRLGDIHSGSDA